MWSVRPIKFSILIIYACTIAACGGGGGSDADDTTQPPLPNVMPTADAGADQSINENITATLVGSGTDSDGSIASYSWAQTAGTSVTLSSSSSPSVTFTAPTITADETLTFQLTVTDNDGATAVSSTNVQIINILTTTISGVVYSEVIEGATIVLMDQSNNQIAQATSNELGQYSLTFENDQPIDNCYNLSAIGGTIAGVNFTEVLTATYCGELLASDNFNITPITTLIDTIANNVSAADAFTSNNAAMQQLINFGILTEDNAWNSLESEIISYGMLTLELKAEGGVSAWIQSVIDDLSDQQLSPVRVTNVFKHAHGGIAEIITADISLFAGQSKNIRVSASLSEDTLPAPVSYSLIDAPEWMTLVSGELTVEPSANIPSGQYGYQVTATPENGSLNRINSFEVEVLSSVILIEGALDIDGGDISNAAQDIVLTAPVGALSQPYSLVYRASISEGGALITNLTATPEMPNSELAQLLLLRPSSEILIETYLQDQLISSQTQTKQLPFNPQLKNSTRTRLSSIFDSALCKQSAGDDWQDRNEDGFSFDVIWDCWDDSFFDPMVLRDGIDGGIPFTYKALAENNQNIKEQRAFVLRSNTSIPSSPYNNRIPVLFVHGFVKDGTLGGFNYHRYLIGDFKDISGEYFGAFPKLVNDYSTNDEQQFTPFLFQWRTNVPFQVGAHYLGEAIKSITQTTGMKVHIVAHSFGGILSRSLIQGLAQNKLEIDGTTFSLDFVEENIASLTTIGTPHSGIYSNTAFDRTSIHNDSTLTFPGGTDNLAGTFISTCNAITCHQMGVNTQWLLTLRSASCGGDCSDLENGKDKWFGMHENKGFIVHELQKKLETPGWPNIKTQVLIGLIGDPDLLKTGLDRIGGDGLISLAGQRFDAAGESESDAYKDLLSIDTYNRFTGSSYIDEHFLGFQEFNQQFTQESKSDTNLFRDFTDYYLADIQGDLVDRINLEAPENNSMTVSRVVKGYNHRTGKYNDSIIGADMASEVGLQECTSVSPDVCRHNTWQYFTSFMSQLDLEETVDLPPPPTPEPPPHPELPPNYIEFLEGNPGVEDDGIFVDASNISITDYSLTVEPKPLVGILENGVIITVVTKLPTDQAFAQVYFEFGYLGSECLYVADDNNNVSNSRNNFEAAYYSPKGLEVVTENARAQSGCENINVSEMFLNRIEFLHFGLTNISIDAVIVERGPVVPEPPSNIYGSLTITSNNQENISFVPTSAFGSGSVSFLGQWNGPDNAFMQISLSSTSSLSLISFRPNFSIGTLMCLDGNGEINANACSGVTINLDTKTLTFLDVKMAVPTIGGAIYSLNGALLY